MFYLTDRRGKFTHFSPFSLELHPVEQVDCLPLDCTAAADCASWLAVKEGQAVRQGLLFYLYIWNFDESFHK